VTCVTSSAKTGVLGFVKVCGDSSHPRVGQCVKLATTAILSCVVSQSTAACIETTLLSAATALRRELNRASISVTGGDRICFVERAGRDRTENRLLPVLGKIDKMSLPLYEFPAFLAFETIPPSL